MSTFVRHPGYMDESGDKVWGLEARMEQRLDQLGISWTDLSQHAQISRQALLDIRNGVTNPRRSTRRKIERALELELGGFEQMQRGEQPTPVRGLRLEVEWPTADAIALGDLEQILTVPRETLIKISRLVESVSGPVAAEKFLLDALELRRRHAEGGIKPSSGENRDVS